MQSYVQKYWFNTFLVAAVCGFGANIMYLQIGATDATSAGDRGGGYNKNAPIPSRDPHGLEPNHFFAERLKHAKEISGPHYARSSSVFIIDHCVARVAKAKDLTKVDELVTVSHWKDVRRHGPLNVEDSFEVEVAPGHPLKITDEVRVFMDDEGCFVLPKLPDE